MDDASKILGEIDASSFNVIETNYKTFYSLYMTYLALDADVAFSYDDGVSLKNLAELRPGENGPVIYQAIALYNTIYGKILIPDCFEGEDERRANTNVFDKDNPKIKQTWKFTVFPNPVKDQLTITSTNEVDVLTISISDLSQRKILVQTVNTNNFISKLDINLINGAYFITVRNSRDETLTKKLLIAK